MTPRVETYSGSSWQWNDFARRQPGYTHYHRYEWRSVMERVLGHQCMYRVARGEHGIEGVLPLVRVKSALFGHYLMSMPFLNYGGPLGTPAAVNALVEDAAARARED